MNQPENKKVEIPILAQTLENSIEKGKKPVNAQKKYKFFIFVMISGIVISLSMLIAIVASVNIWRPKLFPQIQTIQHLEQDIQSLKQTIIDLNQDTKNKEVLINEIASLKQEVDQIKANMQIEMAIANDKLNAFIVEQNNKAAEILDKKISTDQKTEISMDANVFYAQFLAAIEGKENLLKFYEHAEKLNLSNEFKDIITNIRKINFEKIKSNENLLTEFDQMQNDILKETMLTSIAQKYRSNIIKNIKNNIQISSNQEPNRVQLKKDLIEARKLFTQDDMNSAIDILKFYAHHKHVGLWIKHAEEKKAHDEAIQNVRNFKGPYSQ